ncbi:hypothetical protein XELAEV_18042439mg [Xenopus laevis]|uniref:GIY-YIG domain-containing protein n=1 Tax=Xenopus laevis TaxID=8355 RepID=A0A974H628_XENLA|nr:hypothetical protein XELAEV_18042439mg [Xenopus laevis]
MFRCGSTRRDIRSYINCNTKSMTYCLKCYKQYVGCTIRNLKNRIREHLNIIKSVSESSPVSRHFKECNDGDVKGVLLQGIDRVSLGPERRGSTIKIIKSRSEIDLQVTY